MTNGSDRLRSALRKLRRPPHHRPEPPEDDPGAEYIAQRLDLIEGQLKTLNRLLGGSLLTLLAEFGRQLLSK